MFKYLHCYMPETWDAQIKAGLIDENAGIRFMQTIDLDESKKFNAFAAKDGALYRFLKDKPMPFYIDRLQGGSFFQDYKYDKALINAYTELLGDNFWGFQMHEWASNLACDYEKIRNDTPYLADGKHWNQAEIEKTIRRKFPYEHLFLEAMNSKEFAECGDVDTYDDFLKVATQLFRKRQAETNGNLLPCNSFFLSFPLEIRCGAKRFMPEIGAQSENTRLQIAFARGMAKASGTHFGAYYESWGGEPFSACNYHRQGLNEWCLCNDAFPFEALGGNGGSSRSMQMRMHLYAYMAGAEFISEEWGMCNTFYDWEDFELTPYGHTKLDFLNFTRKYRKLGKPVTPVAVVLPAWFGILEGVHCDMYNFGRYKPETSKGRILNNIRNVLRAVFEETTPMLGNETTSLLNHTLPDAVDIVTEDFINTNDYEYLIDLTANPAFAENKNKIDPEELSTVLSKCMPCRVDGGLHHIVTKTENGKYYLLILNNSGVLRTVQNGEKLLAEANKTVTVTTKDSRDLTMLEGNATISKNSNEYFVSVPAGGWFFGKF